MTVIEKLVHFLKNVDKEIVTYHGKAYRVVNAPDKAVLMALKLALSEEHSEGVEQED